jgi:hypothetical protein
VREFIGQQRPRGASVEWPNFMGGVTRLFLSYARGDDEPFVARLADTLTSDGFEVWFDRRSMPSRALTFLDEIRRAIDGVDRVVAVGPPPAAAAARAAWP